MDDETDVETYLQTLLDYQIPALHDQLKLISEQRTNDTHQLREQIRCGFEAINDQIKEETKYRQKQEDGIIDVLNSIHAKIKAETMK